MNYTVDGSEAVPILITHRVIKRQPKVNVTRKFVGLVEGFRTLAVKAIDLIQESFWKDHREIVDPGDCKIVHYAIDVEDDGTDPEQGNLVATKISGTARPGFGAQFEVVRIADSKPVTDGVIRVQNIEESESGQGKAKVVGERPKPRLRQNEAPKLPRPRMREQLPHNLEDFEGD